MFIVREALGLIFITNEKKGRKKTRKLYFTCGLNLDTVFQCSSHNEDLGELGEGRY